MLAYLVLLLAVLSRFLPHLFHATAWNFTAVGGGLLFFGSQLGGKRGASRWKTWGGVAAAVLDDHVVAEDPLEAEPEALRGVAGGLVTRVALPLEAAVAELIERMAGEQEDRFGRALRALQLTFETEGLEFAAFLHGTDKAEEDYSVGDSIDTVRVNKNETHAVKV